MSFQIGPTFPRGDSYAAVEAFVRERVRSAVGSSDHFRVGTVEDDCYCLLSDEDGWIVDAGERGKLRPLGRFPWPIDAAKFLILNLLNQPGSFAYPAVDWTGFASLPD